MGWNKKNKTCDFFGLLSDYLNQLLWGNIQALANQINICLFFFFKDEVNLEIGFSKSKYFAYAKYYIYSSILFP